MPEMLLRASSRGSTTAVVSSSGLAPDSWTATFTVAGSAFGNRSTPRSKNEKMPSTTSSMTSIVAKTGRRTHSSDNDMVEVLLSAGCSGRGLRLETVGEDVHIRRCDGCTGRDSVGHLDTIAEAIAEFDLMRDEAATIERKDAIDAVAVLNCGGRDRE